jgi:alkylation response protein AidB-like acyl-CoA dehydrogenase
MIPMETPGVKILRLLTVFNYDIAPPGHAAQRRLGSGRIHHCMRLIGMAERALQPMKTRVQERVAFGKASAEQGNIVADIACSRMEIEQARLLTLKAAHMMDTVGNKVGHMTLM